MSAILAPEPASKKKYTADDLLKMPDGDRYELVDGELVGSKTVQHQRILQVRSTAPFTHTHVKKNKLGWAFLYGTTYQCSPNHKTVRRPDASFIKKGRLPGESVPTGHIKIVPDLAVEVISPFDVTGEVDDKVEDT